MVANWEKNWIFLTALKRLAIDPTLLVSIENAESCLPQVFGDALAGRFGRLREREDMKPLAAVLPSVLERLRRKMESVELSESDKLPPVVWLRLMQEADVKPVSAVLRVFKDWQAQMRADGMTVLYRRWDRATKSYRGPKRERDGLGKLVGYTVEEMLVHQPKKANWPYCYQWKFFGEVSGSVLVPKTPQREAVLPKLAPGVSERIQKVKVGIDRPKKRRKRSRQDVERACGKRVVAALEECLAVEFSRKRIGVLEAGRKKDHRTYKCLLSLNELVSELRRKYGKQLAYSDSTLKSALPYFVACPRGRPGGLD